MEEEEEEEDMVCVSFLPGLVASLLPERICFAVARFFSALLGREAW